jgi:hypothetical protein
LHPLETKAFVVKPHGVTFFTCADDQIDYLEEGGLIVFIGCEHMRVGPGSRSRAPGYEPFPYARATMR